MRRRLTPINAVFCVGVECAQVKTRPLAGAYEKDKNHFVSGKQKHSSAVICVHLDLRLSAGNCIRQS
jgi:hypothetical protein